MYSIIKKRVPDGKFDAVSRLIDTTYSFSSCQPELFDVVPRVVGKVSLDAPDSFQDSPSLFQVWNKT